MVAFLAGLSLHAQPAETGGAGEAKPGRIHVDTSHARASDTNPGTPERPLKTINRGARMAKPGDAVVIHAGIYRETIVPTRGGDGSRPITYRSFPGDEVIVRGSVVWDAAWAGEPGSNLYSAPIDLPVVDDYNPFLLALNLAPDGVSPYVEFPVRPVAEGKSPVCTMGQLFVNGELLVQVPSKAEVAERPRTWCVSRDGERIWLHAGPRLGDPAQAVVEASVRTQLFRPYRRGLGHIHIRGLVFEHAVNPGPMPQAGMVSVRSGHHWVIEDCVIRHAKTIGLDCGGETGKRGVARLRDTASEDRVMMKSHSHIIRNNLIESNGVCGISALLINKSIFYGNTFRNNANLLPRAKDYHTERMRWNEWGGLKIHGLKNGVIIGNRFEENHRAGLFLDTHFAGAIVSGNLFLDQRAHGVIFEREGRRETYCVNNLFFNSSANDIRTMDVSKLTVANNLCAAQRRPNAYSVFYKFNFIPGTWRGGAAVHVAVRDNRIMNNIFYERTHIVEMPDIAYAKEYEHYQNPVTSNFNLLSSPEFAFHNYELDPESKRAKYIGKSALSYEEWMRTTGNDTQSTMVDEMDIQEVRLDGNELVLTVGRAFFDLETDPECQPPYDYFGKPIQGRKRLPGPFQDLKPGENRITVWPLEVDDAKVGELIEKGRIRELVKSGKR